MYSQLRLLMFKKRVTMANLGDALNLSRNTISRKISGKTKFTIDELLKIRDMFFPDVTLDELGEK